MVLVTGANGFIGSALAKELNKRGINDLLLTDYVSVEDRSKLLKGINYQKFMNPDELLKDESLFNDIDQVFHMGACSSTTETNWDYLKKVNLDYSISLYKLCHKHSIPFIYASSAATYGNGEFGFDDKKPTSTYKPLNLYGKSKADFDIWMENNADSGFKWSGFRFFNVYGPNEYFKESMASMVYKGFHQVKSTSKLKLFKSYNPEYEDGRQLRDFVYIKDIVSWLIAVSEKSDFKNGIYNMGAGKAKSWLDLAESLFSSLDKELKIDWIEMPPEIRDQYQYFTEADMTKFYSQGIGQSEWPLDKAVHDYVKNYLIKDEATYA